MSLQLREGSNDGLISTVDLSPGGAGLPGGVTTAQGLCVKLDTVNQGQFVVCNAGTDVSVGTLLDQPLAGQTATIRTMNSAARSYVQLGGTVAIGAALGIDTTGRAVAITQSAAGAQPTKTLIGYAAEAGTINGIITFYPAGVGEKF